jgi:hypothetical protein
LEGWPGVGRLPKVSVSCAARSAPSCAGASPTIGKSTECTFTEMSGKLLCRNLYSADRAKPRYRFSVVLHHAQAIGIHGAEIVLGVGSALIGSETKSLQSFAVVLRDAQAIDVVQPEFVMRHGEALIRSEAIPLRRLDMILRHTPAVGVPPPVPLASASAWQSRRCGRPSSPSVR